MTNNEQPKISVVTVTYNFEKYLPECIESVLSQTLLPFEFIICDDCSTDNSWTIISEYAQKHKGLIKPYRHEKNLGPALNGTFGRKKATGELITFIEGDDRWLPRKLEMEWQALQENPDSKIAYSDVYMIDSKGNRTGAWCFGNEHPPPSGDVFIETFSKRFFPNTRSLFRNYLAFRSERDEIGYHDTNIESYWDWDEKIRLTSRYHVAYSGKALVEYRVHDGGISNSRPEMHFRAAVRVYEKNLALLNNRSSLEAIFIKCNVESWLTSLQKSLPSPQKNAYYSARSVYDRNWMLLEKLPEQVRCKLKKRLSALLAQLEFQTFAEEIKEGHRKIAFLYFLKSLRNPTVLLTEFIKLPIRTLSRLKLKCASLLHD